VASLLGFEKEHFTYEIPGVNHFVWMTKMFYKGEDMMPRFARWVEEESEAYFQTCGMSNHMGPKPVDLYRRFGAIPIGDTATVGGGAWGWWYHTDDEVEKGWKEDPKSWWEGHFSNVERTARENYRISHDPGAEMTDYLPPHKSAEQMVPIIESIACDLPQIYIVNVLNSGGYVPGISTDFAVEIPAQVSAGGIQAVQTAGLPPLVLQTLIRDRVVPWEIELEAYLKGQKKLLVELVSMDPWTRSYQQARDFVDEILSMPFHTEMKEHYV
jgi:alpha-galactosidase